MKGYILSIDTFSYIYIWNLNFYKENFNTRMFHFIHFTNEYSPTLYHYYNLSLYIPIYTTLPTRKPLVVVACAHNLLSKHTLWS